MPPKRKRSSETQPERRSARLRRAEESASELKHNITERKKTARVEDDDGSEEEDSKQTKQTKKSKKKKEEPQQPTKRRKVTATTTIADAVSDPPSPPRPLTVTSHRTIQLPSARHLPETTTLVNLHSLLRRQQVRGGVVYPAVLSTSSSSSSSSVAGGYRPVVSQYRTMAWSADNKQQEEEEEGKSLSVPRRVAATAVQTVRLWTNDRAHCMAAHPNETWMAAGSKGGEIAIWRFPPPPLRSLDGGDEDDGKVRVEEEKQEDMVSYHRFHSNRVSSIAICPLSTGGKFYTASYDGSVMAIDLQADETDKLLMTSQEDFPGADDTLTTALNTLSLSTPYGGGSQTLATGDEQGKVHLIDPRGGVTSVHKLHHKRLASMAWHPRDNRFFTTAANVHQQKEGPAVCLWDVRRIDRAQPQPVALVKRKQVSTHIAFSPSGTRLVDSSRDNHLYVHNVNAMGLTPSWAVPHDNNTGVWITAFQPQFHPSDDSIFFCGDKDNHTVSVFDPSRRHLVRRLKSGLITGVTSLAAVHAQLDCLISVSYGKAFVWSRMS